MMVKIGVDDQASQKVNGIASGIKGNLGKAAKTGAKAVAAGIGVMTAAGGAAGAAIVSAASSVAEYGDNIDKLSQKMGLSAEAYQEWDAVMQHSGTSMETMKASMKTLANAAENGSDAFAELGLSQEQVASMSQEELFEATIAGLQDVEDTTKRTYLAGKLLGRGATELGALLNTSAEETQEMRDRIHELGGVMSEDAVKASAAFEDSLQDMQTAANGIKNNLIGEFLPAITKVMDGMQELFIGNTDEGFALITEGIGGAFDKAGEIVSKVAPKIAELAAKIGDELTAHAPELAEKTMEFLGGMANGIASMVPVVAEGLGELLSGVILSLPEWGPELLKAAVLLFANIVQAIITVAVDVGNAVAELIMGAVGAIAPYAGAMLEAAAAFFGNIIEGANARAGEIIESANELITGAVDAVGGFVGDMMQAGSDLIQGLIDGIQSMVGSVGEALTNGVGGAIEGLLSFLGIHSPSTLMRGYGEDTMAGYQEGIEGGSGSAESAMENAAADIFAAADKAAGKADTSTIGKTLSDNAPKGVDTEALEPPATQMVKNAIAAAMQLDASGIGENLSATAAAGVDASAMQQKIAALASAASSASTSVNIGIEADTSEVKQLAAAASTISQAYATAAGKASASLKSMVAAARETANGIKAAIKVPDYTAKINVKRGSVELPHFWMTGEYNVKTGAVPHTGVNWYESGAIFAPNHPGIIGIGDAREPEVAAKVSDLNKYLDIGNGGGDTYNIYLQPQGNDYNEWAMLLTGAIETRNRMRGNDVKSTNVRMA